MWSLYYPNCSNSYRNSNKNKYVIFTDSKSVLVALKNRNKENPIIKKIIEEIWELDTKTKLRLVWIPSHVGIAEHDKADTATKAASSAENLQAPALVHYKETKITITKALNNEWNYKWKNNKSLKKSKPQIQFLRT